MAATNMEPLMHFAPYDATLKGYKPYIMAACISFPTKKEAAAYAKAIGWPVYSVKPLVNRFGRCWGLKFNLYDDQFLADPLYSPPVTMNQIGRTNPTPEMMMAYILRCTKGNH